MEASHVLGSKSLRFSTTLPRQKHSPKMKQSHIVAVLTQPADNLGIVREGSILRPAETVKGVRKKSSDYDDNWFDQLAIHHLSQSVQAATGLRNYKSGYESLVEAASSVSRNFDLKTQRELVINALERAFPSQILFLIRTLLPQSKFTREYFAVFTTFFFAWLVGPCEVKESELNGRRERNVVHINKCRFLEQSNCVGMCNNLCKIPSQTFIKKSLGVPVNMVPNFEDMSCEMIFGQDPPINDPALNQPCYKLCKAKQRHSTNCSS